ncbi:hypothetical protein ACJRO7_008869 [Eucalyptus globulus]|uniref:Uncharacterized protein n=1 Tax=Eucalyptus globulus TaxID=34317 RepID=A0ABD3ISM5_EUCGL
MKKFLRVGVILLFLVGTLVQPDEACRVLIKGKKEAWANDKSSVLVLQTLPKGRVPPPGGPGYTPGGPRSIPNSTDNGAFLDQAMAPSPDVADQAMAPSPDVTDNKAFADRAMAPSPDVANNRAFADRVMAPSPEVNPMTFLSHGAIADRK